MDIANPALSVESAVEKLRALGNEILDVDYAGRRIKVMRVDSNEEEVWSCDYCGSFSKDRCKVEEHEKVCPYKLQALNMKRN